MFKYAVAAIGLSALTLPAFAGPEAETFIQKTSHEMIQSSADQIALTTSIDIQRVAHFTLGKYARRISDAEREKYAAAFENFLLSRFDENRKFIVGANVEVIGSTDRNENDSIVETRVKEASGETTIVRWRVINTDGDWRIVDVQWSGLWLAIEQRAQIAAILGKPRASIDDAIEALNS